MQHCAGSTGRGWCCTPSCIGGRRRMWGVSLIAFGVQHGPFVCLQPQRFDFCFVFGGLVERCSIRKTVLCLLDSVKISGKKHRNNGQPLASEECHQNGPSLYIAERRHSRSDAQTGVNATWNIPSPSRWLHQQTHDWVKKKCPQASNTDAWDKQYMEN